MSVGNESWVDRLGLEEGDYFEDLDPVDQVDVVCDAFEREWKLGGKPRVERFLVGCPLTGRMLSRLHHELIPLEMQFRSDAGKTLSFRDYVQRIPDQALFIARFLCENEQEFELDPPLKNIGSYWLLEVVGQGSFGVVYRGYDQELDRFVAVKLPTTSLGDEEGVRRFQREAKNAGRLAHPGIVPIYFVKQTQGGQPFIVSEFVDGTTLDAFLAEKGRLNARTAASLIAQAAEALEYAHGEGIIHRDLKPGNIILESRKTGDSTQDGTLDDTWRPKLLDFGLARRQDGDASTSIRGAVVGTPAYMSPEQARGDASVDHRADIYSLGAILYELLFGQRCFPGESFSAVLLQVISEEPELPSAQATLVPKDLITICMKCLNKQPADRYPRAADLADDLRRWLRREEIKARPLSHSVKTFRWLRHNKMYSAGIATMILLMAIVTMVSSRGLNARHREIISQLETAPSGSIRAQIEETRRLLASVPGLEDGLRRQLEDGSLPPSILLRYRIALGDELPRHARRFYDQLEAIPIDQLSTFAEYFIDSRGRESLIERARRGLSNGGGGGLAETVCLSAVDKDWPGFAKMAEQIVDAMLLSPDPPAWARALQPVSAALLPACKKSFASDDYHQRTTAVAKMVVALAHDRPDDLIWFLERASGRAAHVLMQPLRAAEVLPRLKTRLHALSSRPTWHETEEAARLNRAERLEDEVRQRVNLALCYAFADGVDTAQVLGELLDSDEDPRPRTYFIRKAGDSISLSALRRHVAWEKGGRDPRADDVLYCVILAMSQYETKDLQRAAGLAEQLLEVYRGHPDSGVHGAAGYCLRKLGWDLVREHQQNVRLRGYRDDRDWYHTRFGTCMIVIRPGEYSLWRVKSITEPQIGQVQTIAVPRAFAVAATEMTEREYALLTGTPDTESEKPQRFTDFFSLAQEQDLPPDRCSLIDTLRCVDVREGCIADGCFHPHASDTTASCDLNNSGFRIPISPEWLVCCNADALTPRYFGSVQTDTTGFLEDDRSPTHHSVCQFFPNRLGFFGMYGSLHDLTLTKFIFREPLSLEFPPSTDLVLQSDDNLTYHGGEIMSAVEAKVTFNRAPVAVGGQSQRSCLRLAQSLP